jgi:sugar-phosphatase
VRHLLCDAILFDLDGVLIDSTKCVTRHWAEWAVRHALDFSRVMEIAHGKRTIETIRDIAPHLDAEEEATRFTDNEVADTDGVNAIDGAQQLLSSLPLHRWGVVTSGGQELARARLARAGLPFPSILVSGDDVAHGKPAPDPYLEATSRIGFPPASCVAVEDAPAGIQSARDAGIRVIGVATTHAKRQLAPAEVVDRLSDIRITINARGSTRLSIELPKV